MESQFKLDFNGQQVELDDLDLLGEVSGLADDRVLAEIFRITPFDGSTATKAILPYGHQTSGTTGTITPSGADGKVLVNPFRAFVSSRTAEADEARENWHDIRSGLSVSAGDIDLETEVLLSANSSGNPRWDLVMAVVSVNANGPTSTRKVKDPITKVVAPVSVVTSLVTSIAISVVPGSASASPVFPTITADAGDTYYVPLAFIRVPNGFNATSTVLSKDICTQAPVLHLSRTTGGASFSVPDKNYTVSTAEQQSWGSTGTRKKMWMPPDMTGVESLFIAFDFKNASSSNWSHTNTATIDSRDWRDRFTRFTYTVNAGDASALGAAFAPNALASASAEPAPARQTQRGCGVGATLATVAGSYGAVIDALDHSVMTSGSKVVVYCDHADSGKLKVAITGTPVCTIYLWLDFTGPFCNV